MFFMDSVHTYGICKLVCFCEKQYRIMEAVEQRLGSTGHDEALNGHHEKQRDVENKWNEFITEGLKR